MEHGIMLLVLWRFLRLPSTPLFTASITKNIDMRSRGFYQVCFLQGAVRDIKESCDQINLLGKPNKLWGSEDFSVPAFKELPGDNSMVAQHYHSKICKFLMGKQ